MTIAREQYRIRRHGTPPTLDAEGRIMLGPMPASDDPGWGEWRTVTYEAHYPKASTAVRPDLAKLKRRRTV